VILSLYLAPIGVAVVAPAILGEHLSRQTLLSLVAGVALVPVALASHWSQPAPLWLWLLVLGGIHTAMGTGLYFGALAHLPATHVGILGYLEPVGVVLCAWVFLSQRPTWQTVIRGVVVVAAGIWLVMNGDGGPRPGRVEGWGGAESQDGALPSQS